MTIHLQADLLPKMKPWTFGDMLIGGKWRPGQARSALEVKDPYSGTVLVTIPKATVADVDQAFRGAEAAQADWSARLPGERADVFRRGAVVMENRRTEIIDWLIRESGSTRTKAEIEWGAVYASMREASTLPSRLQGRIVTGDYPNKENRIYRLPVGVVAVISPWNWPMHLSTRSILPALALGNTVVVKPAAETPVTGGLLIAKIMEAAGLPTGALSVIVGSPSDIGDAFVQHPVSRVISFTGSTKVGRHIGELALNGTTLKKTMLELGGNGPFVVLDDADIDQAVRTAIVSKFLHQGQMCIAANRIIVDSSIYDAFTSKFVDAASRLKVGDPNEPDTVIGPIISQHQLNSLNGMIGTAAAEGAKKRLGQPAKGLLLPPHVFEVTSEMSLGRSEIFGPIAPIIRAKNEDDALRLANDTEYGLTSAVMTTDIHRGAEFAKRIKAGMTHVNDVTAIDMPALPFGGEKSSGMGRFGSPGMIESFTSEHWISIQLKPASYPF